MFYNGKKVIGEAIYEIAFMGFMTYLLNVKNVMAKGMLPNTLQNVMVENQPPNGRVNIKCNATAPMKCHCKMR